VNIQVIPQEEYAEKALNITENNPALTQPS
jgi:hypothetical protein